MRSKKSGEDTYDGASSVASSSIFRLKPIAPGQIKFGDKIQLWTRSPYTSSNSVDVFENEKENTHSLEPIGYYNKESKSRGILSVIPPLGDTIEEEKFKPCTFTVVHVSDEMVDAFSAPPAEWEKIGLCYGEPVILVDQDGNVWNNKTSSSIGGTNFIGPRPRGRLGELSIVMHSKVKKDGKPICVGDSHVKMIIHDSLGGRTGMGKELRAFKRTSSQTVGGYLCSSDSGFAFSVTIRKPKLATRGISLPPSIPETPMLDGNTSTGSNYDSNVEGNKSFLEVPKTAKGHGNKRNPVLLAKVSLHSPTGQTEFPPKDWTKPVHLGTVNSDTYVEVTLRTTEQRPLSVRLQCPPMEDKIDPENGSEIKEESSLVPLNSRRVGNIKLTAFWGVEFTQKSQTQTEDMNQQSAFKGSSSVGFYVISLLIWVVALCAFATKLISLIQLTMIGTLPVAILVTGVLSNTKDNEEQKYGSGATLLKEKVRTLRFSASGGTCLLNLLLNESPEKNTLDLRDSDSFSRAKSSEVQEDMPPLEASTPNKSTSKHVEKKMNSNPDYVSPRFLKAENGNKVKATLKYKQYLEWRKRENLDSILSEPQKYYYFIKENYFHCYHFEDRSGHKIYYERPTKAGGFKLDNLLKNGLKAQDFTRHYVFLGECAWQSMIPGEDTKTYSIIDLKGMQFSETRGVTKEISSACTKISTDYYPERCHKSVILNAPMWFSTVYKVYALMLSSSMREKVKVFGTRASEQAKAIAELHKDIDPRNLPPELNGSSVPFGEAPEELHVKGIVDRVLAEKGMQPFKLST
eukprot:m.36674 g.36674  ORF g.36674 m.36674 type:complete len:800 (-) comp9173_c0_seq1:1355-3754(-)